MKRRSIRAFLVACVLAGCSFGNGSVPPGVPGAAPPAASKIGAPLEVVSFHGVAALHLDAETGQDGFPAFFYKGKPGAPTIRVNPGDTIRVDVHDGLAGTGMGADMNLHFHGLGVSPRKPSDDVLTMLATPGQTLHYAVHVPLTQPPGLYWYHPHVHGETELQVGLGGMSGAIVIGGIEKHYPVLANLRENILVVREVGDAGGTVIVRQPRSKTPHLPCPTYFAKDWLTVNNQPYPTLTFAPGKPTFFGIINASGDRTMDIAVDGAVMHVVAVDGYPVDTHEGNTTLTVRHFVVPPAGRVEFYATMNRPAALRTLCFDSGPAGDPDPAQVLAHLTPGTISSALTQNAASPSSRAESLARTAPANDETLPPPVAHRVVNLSENAAGTQFFINGQAFNPYASPMFVVRTGTVERWTVKNLTHEMHDFHMHQTHFLVVSIDGNKVEQPTWRDTFVVPWAKVQADGSYKPGRIEMLVDFRNPVIRGTFLFHCHILNHEDNGMMAKIEAI